MEQKKILTPNGRVSYPNLFKAKAGMDGGEEKYSIQLLFPKSADLSALKKAAHEAAVAKWGADKTKWPKMRSPFKDGNDKGGADYKDMVYIDANSKFKPAVVDKDVNDIIDASEIYPGCYARATVVAATYDVTGNRGVKFWLQAVQKVKDGERLGGTRDLKSDFTKVEELDESFDESTDF
jgi:hypothetical protein